MGYIHGSRQSPQLKLWVVSGGLLGLMGRREICVIHVSGGVESWVVYMRGSCFPTAEAVGCILWVVGVGAEGRGLEEVLIVLTRMMTGYIY